MSVQDWLDSGSDFIRESLAPPLKQLHEPIDRFLAGLPMTTAKVVILAFFVAAGIWVALLPKKFVYLGAPDEARWRDLRVWSILVLIPYFLVYFWWG